MAVFFTHHGSAVDVPQGSIYGTKGQAGACMHACCSYPNHPADVFGVAGSYMLSCAAVDVVHEVNMVP